MILAGVLTLALPLVGWQSVKQLYLALQQTRMDEQALKAANMRLALSESDDVISWLERIRQPASIHDWYAERSPYPLFVDGYDDDWVTLNGQWNEYPVSASSTADGVSPDINKVADVSAFRSDNRMSFRVAMRDEGVYLFIRVTDKEVVYHRPLYLKPDAGEDELPDRWQQLVNGDAIEIAIEQTDGQVVHGVFRAMAPGPVEAVTASDTSSSSAGAQLSQWQGFWSRTADGYQLEVQIPLAANGAAVAIALVDRDSQRQSRAAWVGSASPALMAEHQASILPGRLYYSSLALSHRLDGWTTQGMRARLFDANGLLVADVNKLYTTIDDDNAEAQASSLDGVIDALLFRVFALLAADDLPLLPEPRPTAVTLNLSEERREAFTDSQPVSTRYVTDENDRVLGTLAPVSVGASNGFLLLEANEEHVSAYAGSQLARVFALLMLVTLIAGGGLFAFATVLSARIRRLAHDTEQAIGSDGRVAALAGSESRDEIGDLSRKLSTLLSRSAQYTQYLEALSGRLSHELRTPLSVVSTSLENIDKADLDEQSQMLVTRAEGGASQLRRIIKALVDATRLEQSVQNTQAETVYLKEWLPECQAVYQQVYPECVFVLRPETLPGLKVRIAPQLLRQAMDKLVENAVSFSTDRVVMLQLSQDTGTTTARAVISVANRGPAIERRGSGKLFDPLVSQREANDDDDSLHLGLGLYMVRLIAEASQGETFVRNERGWVVFGVSLPAC